MTLRTLFSRGVYLARETILTYDLITEEFISAVDIIVIILEFLELLLNVWFGRWTCLTVLPIQML
jgi:hypothetical protein